MFPLHVNFLAHERLYHQLQGRDKVFFIEVVPVKRFLMFWLLLFDANL